MISDRPSPIARRPAARSRRAGFALLITITLLAFLVVLLVGLASYMRVETSIAGNTQRQTQARQNALLALNVALGQLQKYAGPDQRVTATAEARPASETAKSYATRYVGVWDTTQAATTTPLTWLVSGNELQGGVVPLAKPPTATLTTSGTAPTAAELVGKNSTGTANSVIAPLVGITAVGVPGNSAVPGPTIGRYAWWIGDQGVKAPVALGDPTATAANFNYAPYDSAEVLSRIRQQISLGAGAAAANGNVVFEPRDIANSPLVANQKVTAYNQLAFLKNSSGTALGLAPLKTNFHTWSPNNFNVLANTKLGGLRQDLSLKPDLLGSAFAAWANYDPANGGYMEDFKSPMAPLPSPALSADPLRRRYVMKAAPASVSPTVSYFLLSFNVHTQNGSQAVSPLEVRAFWKLGLWNPYGSSLVPEDNLRLEVTGLPFLRVDDATTGTTITSVSLQDLYGAGNPNTALRILLPWVSTPPSGVPGGDRASWLPGRVYNWRSVEETTGTIQPAGYPSRFYAKSYTSGGETNGGVIRPLTSAPSVDGNHLMHIDGNAATLRIKLIAARTSGDAELANFTAPAFTSFTTTDVELYKNSTQFVYIFRQAESTENPAWLQTAGADPHDPAPASTLYAYGPQGASPAAYSFGYQDSTFPDRLLDRDTTYYSFGRDTPVFELPRAPLLSLGALQHLAISAQRPFAIGNSWGADPANPITLNSIPVGEVFDRFFFSGLVTGVTPSTVNGSLMLPNPQLKPLPRNSATGAAVALMDLQNTPAAQSSKFLLQGAAFNVNSASATAWTAVLRALRFPAPSAFNYLTLDTTTGTGADDAISTVQSNDAQLFRFSHAAGETFQVDSTNTGNQALFRQGMRTLTGTQSAALASAIATAVAAHNASSGPFRTLEEFLGPSVLGSPSLLEQAILNANLNASVAEFSSQWLTQGDIMTALAPVLFPRSDTFVIRTYGEAVNPTTAVTEGRAWCEAIVQRVPEYFGKDANSQPEETAPADLNDFNKTFGRRFKIVSFRWLNRSDI